MEYHAAMRIKPSMTAHNNIYDFYKYNVEEKMPDSKDSSVRFHLHKVKNR